jgi:hypothetical protein
MYHLIKLRKKIGFLILASLLMLVNSSYAQTPCKTSGVTFIRQSQLDSFDIFFPGCTYAEDINIYGQAINNLLALNKLQKANNIVIKSTKIKDLSGLNNIFKSSLILDNNNDLLHIRDIKNLTKGFRISISECSELTSFEGIDADSITFLTLTGKIKTKSLNDIVIRNVTNLNIIKWEYENLSGGYLHNVKSMLLSGVNNIDSISRFSNLENLNIEYSNLSDLLELNKNFALNFLTLYENTNLSHCAIELICRKINDPNFRFLVEFNKTGCDTVEEIKEACTSSSLVTTSNKLCSFYPNPADGRLVLQNVPFEAKCNIIDLNGHVLKETGPFYSDKVEIDLNQLVPGMYILQIVDKQNLHIMFDKLVKI